MTRLALSYAALLGLTAASLGASFLSLGAWDVPTALAIALSKAGIVGWVFMGLSRASPASRFTAAIGLLFIVLLVGFSTADVVTR